MPLQAVYLDYQASTPMDPRALSDVGAVMAEDFANPHSEGHALGWRARASVGAQYAPARTETPDRPTASAVRQRAIPFRRRS